MKITHHKFNALHIVRLLMTCIFCRCA